MKEIEKFVISPKSCSSTRKMNWKIQIWSLQLRSDIGVEPHFKKPSPQGNLKLHNESWASRENLYSWSPMWLPKLGSKPTREGNLHEWLSRMEHHL